MKIKQKKNSFLKIIFYNFLFLNSLNIFSNNQLGIIKLYDLNYQQIESDKKSKYSFFTLFEASTKSNGFDSNSIKVNPLQIYDTKENIIGLFQGASVTNAEKNRLNGIIGAGVADEANALISFLGEFDFKQCSFGASYYLGKNFSIKAFIPFGTISLKNFNATYSGATNLFSSALASEQLVNFVLSNSQNLFNLSLANWSKTGLGDLIFLLEWEKSFKQNKKFLKNVNAVFNVGLNIPTGFAADQKKIMPLSFGADNSFGLPFSGGLNLSYTNYFKFGFSGQFLYLFGNQKLRRVKTFINQTDLLLPTLTSAYKEFGFIQKFSLSGILHNKSKSANFKTFYEYCRKSEDKITTQSANFNTITLNSQKALDCCTSHILTFLISLKPNFFVKKYKNLNYKLNCFYKKPFKGSNIVLNSSFGCSFSLQF